MIHSPCPCPCCYFFPFPFFNTSCSSSPPLTILPVPLVCTSLYFNHFLLLRHHQFSHSHTTTKTATTLSYNPLIEKRCSRFFYRPWFNKVLPAFGVIDYYLTTPSFLCNIFFIHSFPFAPRTELFICISTRTTMKDEEEGKKS